MDKLELDIESLERVLRGIHSPDIGDSSLARAPRIAEIVSSLELRDSTTSRALALSMLIQSTIEQGLTEEGAPDALELAILNLLYVKRSTMAQSAKLVGLSTRSLARHRRKAIFALAKRLLPELSPRQH